VQKTPTKGVNDHNPFLIRAGEQGNVKDPLFRLEKWWSEVEGFVEVVNKTLDIEINSSDPMEILKTKIRLLRKRIKGWSRNIGGELRKRKASIMSEVDGLEFFVE
jgi:hypothetical protein